MIFYYFYILFVVCTRGFVCAFLEDVQLIIWNLSAFLSGDRFDLSKGKELKDGFLRSRVFRY